MSEKTKESWNRLTELVRLWLPIHEADDHLAMMEAIRDDRVDGYRKLLGFERAPAAKGNHHDHEGGLVVHLLEMWSVWESLRDSRLRFVVPGHIDDARVMKAIIYHDLHKAYLTFELIEEDPWKVDYAKHSTDKLMTTDVKSMWILQDHGIVLDPEQYNALCWAEGGFSSIRPDWSSSLAKLCYTLDELSGNVLERIRKGTIYDLRKAHTE